MTTVAITSYVSSDELLRGVKQLDENELDRFLDQVITLRASRHWTNLTGRESQLLQQINLGIPQSVWRRYDELKARRQSETLTPQEQEELIGLSDKIELANAQRMEALSQLALLRQTPLDDLIAELGIGSFGHV